MSFALFSLAQEAERPFLSYEKGFDLAQTLLEEWLENQVQKKKHD